MDHAGASRRSWAVEFLAKNLNFYRVHLLAFTFIPLIFSGIFYASNGRFKVSYIDSLFNCVSAMTVCGLATVNLSGLTPWQQTILFIQMCLGSPVLASWLMVYTRKYYFTKKLKSIIDASYEPHPAPANAIPGRQDWGKKLATLLTPPGQRRHVDQQETTRAIPNGGGRSDNFHKLNPEMIRRIDAAPKLVNPSGRLSEGHLPPPLSLSNTGPHHGVPVTKSATFNGDGPTFHSQSSSRAITHIDALNPKSRTELTRYVSEPSKSAMPLLQRTRIDMDKSEATDAATHPRSSRDIGPRNQTVEFVPLNVPRHRRRGKSRARGSTYEGTNATYPPDHTREGPSQRVSNTQIPRPTSTSLARGDIRYQGFGGFPMPLRILKTTIKRFFPTLDRKLTRTLTIPRTVSLVPNRGDALAGDKAVPYISFGAVVGRNSAFQLLTTEQRDELGGIEFRALKALLWIVGAYHIGTQLICFIIIAPYISLPRWASTFVPPQEIKPINSVWFSLFQVVSAYSNTGMSLVDQSMIPFQTAYPMIICIIFLVLAGNTCFPIFLRLLIWIIAKCVPSQSRTNETLRFLLDHPRRCYIYLFPSHQTWFLLTVVLLLNLTDWFFFLVLDIGNAAFTHISTGVRVIIGFLQATAVRASGFSVVPIAALVPAVKVLYVITMYISVYPIALSVRSTNVYEERSLGVFEDEDGPEENEFKPDGSRVTVWGKYLATHARRQLAFDMWWLALALFLICIIEQDMLMNPANVSWFNIFNIIFEIVSAYGSVGLSTGIPNENFSLSGAFRTLSKLIVCLVMIRGRHRGLPVAIDRAVLLPSEFTEGGEGVDNGNVLDHVGPEHGDDRNVDATPAREESNPTQG